jgi:toxin HigB-1
MIKSFTHKGLARFFTTGKTTGISVAHVPRLRIILAMLDHAEDVKDMRSPALRLHALKGNLKGHFAVTVQANWRLTFRFENGDAYVVDYQDYH